MTDIDGTWWWTQKWNRNTKKSAKEQLDQEHDEKVSMAEALRNEQSKKKKKKKGKNKRNRDDDYQSDDAANSLPSMMQNDSLQSNKSNKSASRHTRNGMHIASLWSMA